MIGCSYAVIILHAYDLLKHNALWIKSFAAISEGNQLSEGSTVPSSPTDRCPSRMALDLPRGLVSWIQGVGSADSLCSFTVS